MRGRRECHSQDHHGRLACFADIQSKGKSICRLIGTVDEAENDGDRRDATYVPVSPSIASDVAHFPRETGL